MLTLPRSVLVQAAAARTRPDGRGDVATGVVQVRMTRHRPPCRVGILHPGPTSW